MPLLSQKEVLNLKLSSIPVSQLRELALSMYIDSTGRGADLIRRLLVHPINEKVIGVWCRGNWIKRYRLSM